MIMMILFIKICLTMLLFDLLAPKLDTPWRVSNGFRALYGPCTTHRCISFSGVRFRVSGFGFRV